MDKSAYRFSYNLMVFLFTLTCFVFVSACVACVGVPVLVFALAVFPGVVSASVVITVFVRRYTYIDIYVYMFCPPQTKKKGTGTDTLTHTIETKKVGRRWKILSYTLEPLPPQRLQRSDRLPAHSSFLLLLFYVQATTTMKNHTKRMTKPQAGRKSKNPLDRIEPMYPLSR